MAKSRHTHGGGGTRSEMLHNLLLHSNLDNGKAPKRITLKVVFYFNFTYPLIQISRAISGAATLLWDKRRVGHLLPLL